MCYIKKIKLELEDKIQKICLWKKILNTYVKSLFFKGTYVKL